LSVLALSWDEGQPICLVTPRCSYGSLHDVLHSQRFNSWRDHAFFCEHRLGARWVLVAHDICAGLEHMYGRNYVHKDVKSANILLNLKLQPKLCDAGLARMALDDSDPCALDFTMTGAIQGMLGYQADELRDALSLHCTYSTDAFSLGVVFLELLTAMPAVDGTRTKPPLQPLLSNICQQTPAALDGCISTAWQGDPENVQRGQRFKAIAARLAHARPEARLSVGAARQWLAKVEQPPPSGASHAGAGGSSAAGAGPGGGDEAPPDRCCAICMEDYAALLERDGGQQARLLPCRHACPAATRVCAPGAPR